MKKITKIYPEPTVGALIVNKKGEIFLMRSDSKWSGKYVVPGGHVELGEKLEEAVKREMKEETDLDVYSIKALGIQECIFDPTFWKKKHFIFFDFYCKTNSTEVKLNNEGQDFIWVTPKKSLKLPLNNSTRTSIKNYLKNQLGVEVIKKINNITN
ncbi:MAG: NUDIX domain-containing protein [Patescibacteria group bacterium]